jgi:hypothetical protein
MADILTYTTLVRDLQDYSGRGLSSTNEVIAYRQIAPSINDAEREIAADIKLQGYEDVLNTTLETGVAVYVKPDRHKETLSINVTVDSNRKTLGARATEFCNAYWPNRSTTGVPLYWAHLSETHYLIIRTPAEDYAAEFHVRLMPQLLDSGNVTNWLTEEAPELLRAKAMAVFAARIRAPELRALWDGIYKERLAALGGEQVKRMVDRAEKRDSP